MENTVIVLPLVKMLGVEEYKMFLFKITLTLTRPEIFFLRKAIKRKEYHSGYLDVTFVNVAPIKSNILIKCLVH